MPIGQQGSYSFPANDEAAAAGLSRSDSTLPLSAGQTLAK